jgi:hypothetical protein
MVTERIELPAAQKTSLQKTFFSPRLLGTIGMAGAPMLFLAGFLYTDGPGAWIASVVGMLYIVGWAASAAGMRRLRVTGAGAPAQIVFVVQLVGLFLALVFNALEMAHANPDTFLFHATDIAWPASHVFMLVVGALVFRARVWRGWRRWTPALCGLVLPLFYGVVALAGWDAARFIFTPLTAVTFALLGYAVRTSEPRSSI